MESVRILSFELVMAISPGVFASRALMFAVALFLLDAYAYGGFKKLISRLPGRAQRVLRRLYWSFLPLTLLIVALTALSHGKLDGRQIAGLQYVLALMTLVFGAKL
ncbi:MAG: hypothetical protein RMM53_13975, partial [Bacteroidia bacterium]|nr:hypothetical protein [Bacteroidia bacterium]